MDKEEKGKNDQAAQLKKLFHEVQQGNQEVFEEQQFELFEESVQDRKIDVLNLPPRKEVHDNNKSRTKLKFDKPFGRLLAVIILLLIVIAGAFYLWREELIVVISSF